MDNPPDQENQKNKTVDAGFVTSLAPTVQTEAKGFKCQKCDEEFPSNNKLHLHLAKCPYK